MKFGIWDFILHLQGFKNLAGLFWNLFFTTIQMLF